MAQERGAAGPGDHEPGATGGGQVPGPEAPDARETPDVSDAPEHFGNNGLVGEGRYRLTHRLGRGGMAEVFAAEDVRLGRPVAVKLLRADLAEDPVSKARFTREAQSVAGLNHHAVVAVYDSGEEFMPLPGTGGRGNMVPYMVMELVHGRTIRELLIDAEAPPPEQALIIVSGVLEALAYSHQHGIVHRDIKPANVIITETGTVKVMDFGIARALHGAAQTMTATGMVMGTPQYLSPEQALGKTVDTRSDLYAVGCLLYELLALRPPFVGETPLSVVYQHVQDIARPPSEVNADVPPELDGLVMRSLAKDPDDRFQTAEEMRGLVQYGLRMLEEHGGHTGGLWNTGPTAPGGTGATPAMGSPAVAAPGGRRGPGAPPTATTSQIPPPMLLGDPDAGGGGPGGGGHRAPGSGPDGRRRGRMILVALLAVVAIGTGVLVAANLGGEQDDGGGRGDNTTPTATTGDDSDQAETQGQGEDTSDPAAETTAEDEDTGEDDDVWTTPETTPEETETQPPSPTETETGTSEPQTTEETTPEPTESATPTEEPTDEETATEEPTDEPTTPAPTETEEGGTVGGTLP